MSLEGKNSDALPEILERIRTEVLKMKHGDLRTEEVPGCKIEILYDSGDEPETGTKRDDDMVIKITEDSGEVSYANLSYNPRSGENYDLHFFTEVEAQNFIEKEIAHYKPFWEEKKKSE